MNNKKVISAIAILLAVLMLAGLVVGLLPASAFADSDEDYAVNTQASLAELQARRDELAAKAEETLQAIEDLKNDQAALIEQKAAYDERESVLREQIELTEQQVEIYRGLVEQKQLEVDEAKALEEKQLERYRKRVRSMEENGGYNILGVILNADSLGSLLTGIDDIRDIMESDRRLEDQYIAAREEHERVRGEYEAEKRQYEEKLAELEDEREMLSNTISETEKLMKKLAEEIEQNAAEYEAAMNAIQTADAAIEDQIAALYAAYLASQGADTSGGEISVSSDEEGQTYVTFTGSGGGTMVWPVPGCYSVSSDYGYRPHPITGEPYKMHYGMDIDGYGHDGGDIVACDSGVVTTVGYNSGYGNYIVVDHGNGVQTLYAHMSGTAVSQGTVIGQGETIGYLGATGMATGTYCHLEVFVDGENVDPASFFGG